MAKLISAKMLYLHTVFLTRILPGFYIFLKFFIHIIEDLYVKQYIPFNIIHTVEVKQMFTVHLQEVVLLLVYWIRVLYVCKSFRIHQLLWQDRKFYTERQFIKNCNTLLKSSYIRTFLKILVLNI
jgi:hypothetical protein